MTEALDMPHQSTGALISGLAPDAAAAANGNPIDGRPLLLTLSHVIRRQKWIILAIIASCVGIGALITAMTPKQYTATIRLDLSDHDRRISNIEGVEQQGPGRSEDYIGTQYQLLKSRSLAERVARSLGARSEIDSDTVGASPTNTLIDRRARALLSSVTVKPVTGSQLVDVAVRQRSPRLAATIANAWGSEFVAQSSDRRYGATASARRFLETRLQELRTSVERSERDLGNFTRENRIINIEQADTENGRTRRARTLAQLQVQSYQEELARATTQRDEAAAALRNRIGGNGLEGSASPTSTALRTRRAELQAQYAAMAVQFEPGYPQLDALRSQIRQIDQAIAGEQRSNSDTLAGSLRAAEQRLAAVQGRVNQLTADLDRQQSASVQQEIMQREVDTNRQLYEALLQRYKEIGVSGIEPSSIAVVDSAAIPTSASSPNWLVNILVSIILGSGLAAAVVFARESLDEGITDPVRFTEVLGVPLLGIIPEETDGSIIESLTDPKSRAVEAYLAVRTHLTMATSHGMPKTLLVTSTRPNEGKTATAIAMAILGVRAGSRVLLVDADLRAPSVARIAGVENDNGLAQLLAGSDEYDAFIVPSPTLGIQILPAGPQPPNAAELLSNVRAEEVFRELVKRFDYVIVDAPPVLGLADVPILAQLSERVLFVVQAAGVPVRGLQNALRRLQSAEARIIGGVLTRVDGATESYGYGYGYGYGYSYNYGESSNAKKR